MRIRAFAGMLVLAPAFRPAPPPAAPPHQPVTTITRLDRTFTFPAGPGGCPFPFLVHSEGTLRETVFANGKDVTHAVDFHITYTNPANGKVLTTVLAGPFIVEQNADGTVTVTINGNDGHITAPGQGTIFAAVGKLADIADPGDVFTPLAIVQSTGRQDPSQPVSGNLRRPLLASPHS